MPRPRKQAELPVSVYLGSDGDWHGYIQAGAKRLHRQGKTEDIVKAKLRKIHEALIRGEDIPSGRSRKVNAAMRAFLDTCADLSYNTRRNYTRDLEMHCAPHIGDLSMEELDGTAIQGMFTALQNTTGAATRVNVYGTLRTFLKWALAEGEITGRNPLDRVKPPKKVDREVEPLTVEEVREVLQAAEGVRNSARWTLALALGMRQGECLGLEWSRPRRRTGDVDLLKGTIRVRDQLQRQSYTHGCADPHACGGPRGCGKTHSKPTKACSRQGCRRSYHRFEPCKSGRDGICSEHRIHKKGEAPRPYPRGCPEPCPRNCEGHARHCPERSGGLVKADPKSESAKRTIALPEPLRLALKAHKARQEEEKRYAGTAWQESELVFTGPAGQPVDPRRDYDEWQALLECAGVEPARLHDARHTAATTLLVLGVDSRTVMAIMGWSQASMLKRYQHVVEELRREAADRVGGLLWGSPEPPPGVTDLGAYRQRRA